MRIIAGKYGGINLKTPNFSPTRPTTNKAKEALFNSLENYYNFDRICVLDLFAGTGQMSLEFVSRGCEHVTAVEKFKPCVSFINESAKYLKIDKELNVFQMDIFKFLQSNNSKFDVIFADPPYALKEIVKLPDLVFEKELIDGEGWLILEHDNQNDFKSHKNFWKKRKYGSTFFSIFVNK